MSDESLRRKPFYLVHDPDGKIMIVKIDGNSLAKIAGNKVDAKTGRIVGNIWYIIYHGTDMRDCGKRNFLETHMGYKIIDNSHDIEKLRIMKELVSG